MRSQTGLFTLESLGRQAKFERQAGGAVPEANVGFSLSVEKKDDKTFTNYTRLPFVKNIMLLFQKHYAEALLRINSQYFQVLKLQIEEHSREKTEHTFS